MEYKTGDIFDFALHFWATENQYLRLPEKLVSFCNNARL